MPIGNGEILPKVVLGPDGKPADYDRRGDPVNHYKSLRGPDGEPLFDAEGFLLPHARSFAMIYNTITRTYRYTWDEAVRQNHVDSWAMRRDCAILEMLRERQLPTAQLNWHLEPEDPRDPFQKIVAEDLASRIKRGTPRLVQMRMNILEALWYGRSGIQFVYKWVETEGRKELYAIKWVPINGDKIQFTWEGIPQIALYAGDRKKYPDEWVVYGDRFPMLKLIDPGVRQRFLIHAHEIDDADYFNGEMAGGIGGVGIRSRIYWAWWIRGEMISWVVDYMERVGAGGLTIFGYKASNAQAAKEAEYAAKNYSRNTAIAWPVVEDGTGAGKSLIERLEPSEAGSIVLRGLIDYFDEAMRRYIVGQTLSSNADQTGIGGDAAKQKNDLKFRMIRFDTELLDETLTTDFVRPLKDHGYGGQAPFDIRWVSELDKPDVKDQLDSIGKAYAMGASFDEDEIRGLTGLSKPREGAPILRQSSGGESGGPMPGQEGQEPKEPKAPKTPEQQQEVADRFRQMGRLGQPVRYEAGSGQWITIGAKSGEDGKKHGGSPVYVENGRITKGHPGLHGRKIDALKEEPEEKEGQTKRGRHQAEMHSSKEYNRAKWGKKAREEGHKAEHLHQLAGEIMAHDKEYKSTITGALKEARRLSEKLGYGKITHLSKAFIEGDQDQIKGFDDVAERVAESYPEVFAGHEPGARLYDLLSMGNPEPMTEDEAYEEAFNHMGEAKYEQERRADAERTALNPMNANLPAWSQPTMFRGFVPSMPEGQQGSFLESGKPAPSQVKSLSGQRNFLGKQSEEEVPFAMPGSPMVQGLWSIHAQEHGHNPDHLHRLAGQALEANRRRQALIQKGQKVARRLFHALGYGSTMGISQDQDPEDHIGLRKVGGHMQEHMPGLFLDPDNPAAELHRLLFDPERGISEEQAYMWAMNELTQRKLQAEAEQRQRQQQAARMQVLEPDRMARLERDMVLLSDMLDPQRYVNTDAPKSTMTADEIAELLAEQHGNKGKKTAEQLKDKWITSKLFIRQIIPVNAPVGASPVKEGDYSHSTGPIIVDRGKPGYPELFIIDGKHRQAEARARGEREIDAWVGKEALPLLGCAQ